MTVSSEFAWSPPSKDRRAKWRQCARDPLLSPIRAAMRLLHCQCGEGLYAPRRPCQSTAQCPRHSYCRLSWERRETPRRRCRRAPFCPRCLKGRAGCHQRLEAAARVVAARAAKAGVCTRCPPIRSLRWISFSGTSSSASTLRARPPRCASSRTAPHSSSSSRASTRPRRF